MKSFFALVVTESSIPGSGSLLVTSTAAVQTDPNKLAAKEDRKQALQQALQKALKKPKQASSTGIDQQQQQSPTVSDLDLQKQQDWKEILKMRAKNLHKEQPPPPQKRPPGQHQLSNNIVLGRTDEIYRKGTWDKSPIVLEQYKLLFFTVPKVGCTAFKQLFRRMMGHANWRDHQYYHQPFLPHNPDTNGLKYLSDYPFDKANDMLISEEWTRAIFVRDPKERVLSGYLDKAGHSQGSYLRMQCCGRLPPRSPPWSAIHCDTGTKQYTPPQPGETNAPILPLDVFLQHIVPSCPDPHWEAQSTRMAPKYWSRINFVGRFEPVYEDTKRLLEKVGAWEQYGASGWTTADGQDGAMFDPSQKAKHGTKAQDKSSKEEYFTPEVLQMIVQHYGEDYEHPVLKFAKPEIPSS